MDAHVFILPTVIGFETEPDNCAIVRVGFEEHCDSPRSPTLI